jgi:hypothetical protein
VPYQAGGGNDLAGRATPSDVATGRKLRGRSRRIALSGVAAGRPADARNTSARGVQERLLGREILGIWVESNAERVEKGAAAAGSLKHRAQNLVDPIACSGSAPQGVVDHRRLRPRPTRTLVVARSAGGASAFASRGERR